jgi:hypothetical protein
VPVVVAEPGCTEEASPEEQLTLLFQIQLQLPATEEDRAVVAVLDLVLQLLDLVRLVMAGLLAALAEVVADRAVTSATEPTAHRVLLE